MALALGSGCTVETAPAAAPQKTDQAPSPIDAGAAKKAKPQRTLPIGLDTYGPSISVPKVWMQCEQASDCELVYSECGTAHVTVNRKSAKLAKDAWKKRCAELDRGLLAALMMKPETVCEAKQCSSRMPRMPARGLGSALEGLGERGVSRPDQQHGRPPPVGPRARIKVSVPVIEGSLDVELIRRVLRRHRRQWLYCYEQLQSKAPEDAKPAESVVRFKIAAGGRVTMAVAKGDQDKLDACLARSTRRFRFPAPPKKDSVSVKVTASFTPVQ